MILFFFLLFSISSIDSDYYTLVRNANYLHIRPACAQDIDDLVQLIKQLGFKTTTDVIAKKLNHYEQSNFDKVLVGCLNNNVVGFVAINIINSFYASTLFARIDSIIVHENYRRLGIGKNLLKAAEDYARENGCERIYLTSGNHRTEAHKFYIYCNYQTNATYFVKYFSK